MLIATFAYNSIGKASPLILGLVSIVAAMVAFYLSGKVWRYFWVVFIVGVASLIVAICCPIMELILEAVLAEKLKKVGERVRQHHEILERYYSQKR